ncbi:hypothetical protein TWF281_010431 [Arthrobotrys megalospora]
MSKEIVEKSILYIFISLSAIIPLLLFSYLLKKLYAQQLERIQLRRQLRRIEEGVVAASRATNADVSEDDNNNNNQMTAEEIHQQASEDMIRWKHARDLFVKRGGQGGLAEILRSQSRTSEAYQAEGDDEEEEYAQTYVREYSPPPRIPTL